MEYKGFQLPFPCPCADKKVCEEYLGQELAKQPGPMVTSITVGH